MKNIRMFNGSILSDAAAWSCPNFDYQYHFWRMRRMTRNALVFSEVLSRYDELNPYFTAVYPGRADHPDHQIARRFPFIGGTVNMRLLPSVLNPQETLHDILDEMVLSIIEQAKADGSSVCWGEAVGFSIPRVQVHLEWLWRVPPYLRLVAGDRSLQETMMAAHSIAGGLVRYIRDNKGKFIFSNAAQQHHKGNTTQQRSRESEGGEERPCADSKPVAREEMSFFR
jgi:hypothetical protein